MICEMKNVQPSVFVAIMWAVSWSIAWAGERPPADAGETPADSVNDRGHYVHLDRLEDRRKAVQEQMSLDEAEAQRVFAVLDDLAEQIRGIIQESERARKEHAAQFEVLQAEYDQAVIDRSVPRAQSAVEGMKKLDNAADRLNKIALTIDGRVANAFEEGKQSQYRDIARKLSRSWRRPVRPIMFAVVYFNLEELGVDEKLMTKVHEINKELTPALSNAFNARDDAGAEKVSAEFRERILKLLTNEQRAEYLVVEKRNNERWDKEVPLRRK